MQNSNTPTPKPPTVDVGSGEPQGMNFGMSLRDYFAARFAAAMVGTPDGCNVISRHAEEDGIRPTERMALVAYDLADAMLRVRQRGANVTREPRGGKPTNE